MFLSNKLCIQQIRGVKMCILKTVYIAAASILMSILLLSFTQTNYTKHYAITSKNVKLNEINNIKTYENGALIKGGKVYIRTDIIESIDQRYEIKNNNAYISISLP